MFIEWEYRSTYLVVHLFIKCLDGISELVSLKIIVQEYILELIDHSIKDGNSDLNRETEE